MDLRLLKPSTCEGCPLAALGEGFVVETGPDRDAVIMAEALGREEAEHGRAFAGGAGRVLDRLLHETSWQDRGSFKILNTLSCRPPDNRIDPFMPKAMNHCAQYREPVLQRLQPKVIVAFGNWALHALTGYHGIERRRGYLHTSPFGMVMPTFHPAAIMRRREWWSIVVMDLERAYEYYCDPAAHGLIEPSVIVARCSHDVASYLDGAGFLAVDIENKGPALLCIGFAKDDHSALVVPYWGAKQVDALSVQHYPWWWRDDAEGLAVHRLLWDRLADPTVYKVFHNGAYDVSRLQAVGFEVNGWAADTMVMMNTVWAELRKSLEFTASLYGRLRYWKSDAQVERETEESDK